MEPPAHTSCLSGRKQPPDLFHLTEDFRRFTSQRVTFVAPIVTAKKNWTRKGWRQMLAGRPPTGVEILSSYGSVESACTDEISSLPWDTATPDLMGNGLEFFFFFLCVENSSLWNSWKKGRKFIEIASLTQSLKFNLIFSK